MKKQDLTKLALIGIASGIFISATGNNGGNFPSASKNATETSAQKELDKERGNITYHLMSESELMLELTPEGASVYKTLSPEGKVLALKVASGSCNGTNECRGLNACQTDTNDCAGKGKCKGQGKCAFSDKTVAVKLVAAKMGTKRQNAIN